MTLSVSALPSQLSQRESQGDVSTDSPIVSTTFHAAPRPSSGSPRRASFPRGKLLYRAFGWYHSSAQVIIATWRAADCRPYWRGTIHPHGLSLQRGGRLIAAATLRNTIHPHGLYWGRFRNGTQAVPYGFADWFVLEPTDFKSGHVRCPIIVNCPLSIVNLKITVNCQLISA